MENSLTTKYRPRALADLLGQRWVSEQLSLFVAKPYSCAFLFQGETGTGKTTAAMLLAEALGVVVEEAEFGGLYTICSGEQTGESVRRVMAGLHNKPFLGSGWRVLIVNEMDHLTPGAAVIWLDALEALPPRCLIVFTTNAPGKIPARLRDRCERLAFESSALLLRPALQELAERVWRAETGREDCPPVEAFGRLADENGNASFRRLLQQMTPHVRTGHAPAPVAQTQRSPAGSAVRHQAAVKAWATRRAKAAQLAQAS